MTNSKIIEEKLKRFNIRGKIVSIARGPVITCYEYAPEPDIKISKIISLSEDVALALKSKYVPRIAPIPGKSVIGIEVPNKKREIVYLKEILVSDAFQKNNSILKFALGKDVYGNPIIADLADMPHLLIAGATGSGKSVCINCILCSFLYNTTPKELRCILIDPKMLELSIYNDIPHLREPVITNPEQAPEVLRWAVYEMEQRYKLLARMGVRNLKSFNEKLKRIKENENSPLYEEWAEYEPLPYLVIIIDELSDLMMVSAKAIEEYVIRLAQMARAAGIHLILATQRPSVDVITGIIKANIPSRIAFQVTSKVDSRTILDRIGAEKLLGKGDMLFLPPRTSKIIRVHGAYVSESEIKKIVDFWAKQPHIQDEMSIFEILVQKKDTEIDFTGKDELYKDAIRCIIETGVASISMLQRRFKIGHARAARLIDMMERDGIVGPHSGSKPREILVDKDFLEKLN